MKIIHRMAARLDASHVRELQDLGLAPVSTMTMPGETIAPLVVYLIDEAHPHWAAASELLGELDAYDSVDTKFTAKEIADSPWLRLGVRAHTGYPEPDSDEGGYKSVTYDLSHACDACGTRRVQKAPFRMKGEPRWGRKGILQLNWVFDEFFVQPDVHEAVFAPFGIECSDVEDARGKKLESVVQLVVDETADVGAGGLPSWECPACGSTMYNPVARGPFPRVLGIPSAPLVRTRQYFSGGGWGYQLVLARADLAASMRAAGVRGAVYVPTDWNSPESQSDDNGEATSAKAWHTTPRGDD